MLEARIQELGMNPEDYWWYCDLAAPRPRPPPGSGLRWVRWGVPPHGGDHPPGRSSPNPGAAPPTQCKNNKFLRSLCCSRLSRFRVGVFVG